LQQRLVETVGSQSIPHRAVGLILLVIAALALTPRYVSPLLIEGEAFRAALHVHAISGTA